MRIPALHNAGVLRQPAVAISLAALAVRVVWLVLLGRTEIAPDGAEYARVAANLLHGHGFTGIHGTPMVIFPPLYSLAIAALMPLARTAEAAGVTVSLLAGAAAVFPVYGAARRLYGPGAALVAGTVVAFLPFAVDMSVLVLSDAFFMFLAATALYFLIRVVQDARRIDAFLAALFYGLAYLTRPEGLVLAAAGVAAGIGAFALLPALRGRLLRCGAIYVVTLAVVAAPYVAYLSGRAHALRFEGKSAINATIAARMRAGMDYVQAADATDDRLDIIGPELDDDGYFADRWVREPSPRERIALLAVDARRRLADVPRTLVTRPYGTPVIALLALAGLAGGAWGRRRLAGELTLVLYGLGLFLSLTSLFHFWARYAFGFVPLLAVWSGHGTALALGLLKRRIAPALPAALIAAACLLLAFSQRAWFRANVNDATPLAERAAGTWIAAEAGPNPGTILDVSDQSAYYAGGTWSMLPYTPRPGVALAYVLRKNAQYLVLDRSLAGDRGYVTQWLAHGVPDPRAQLVYASGDAREPDVAIYRLYPTAQHVTGVGPFGPSARAR